MDGALCDDTKTAVWQTIYDTYITVGRNTSDDAKSVAETSYAIVCLDGCKTDGCNHKKDNRMITEFGQ